MVDENAPTYIWQVLQAALDNLLRRNLLPAAHLSLSYVEDYVAALAVP